ASIAADIDKDSYTLGETLTGSVVINNKTGSAQDISAVVSLYQEKTLYLSKDHHLSVSPGITAYGLEVALGITPTLPDDYTYIGNWSLQFTVNAGACQWRAEDGFKVVTQVPNLSISIEMNKDVFYLGDCLNGVVNADCTTGENLQYSIEIFKGNDKYKDWSGDLQCDDNGNITFEIYNLFSEYCIDPDTCYHDMAFAQIPYDGYDWIGDYSITATVSDGQYTVSGSDDFIIDFELESERKLSIDVDLNNVETTVSKIYGPGVFLHPPLNNYYLKKENSEFRNPIYRVMYHTYYNLEAEDWEVIQKDIEALSSKIKILQTEGSDVEINIWGMPRYLSTRPDDERRIAFGQPVWATAPPKDYAEWSNFIEKIVREFEKEGVTNVIYGMWNEPEFAFFGVPENDYSELPALASEAEFAKLYVWFEKGVKRANPLLKAGITQLCPTGTTRHIYDPRTNTYSDKIYMEELIKSLGEYSDEIDLDYFGGHYEVGFSYPNLELNLAEKMELINYRLSENGFDNVKYNIGEWVPVNCCSGVMATEIAASRIPQVLKVYEDAGIDRHTYFWQRDLVSFHDGVGTNTEYPPIRMIDTGLVRSDTYAISHSGPVRSTYNVFRALSVVSENERIHVDDSSIFSLASTDSKKTAILLSNYNPLSRDITLNVDNLPQGDLKVRTFTIDKEHSNVCRLNQKTAEDEPITPRDFNCGKNGEIDKLTKQANEDAISVAFTASRDFLISKGYSGAEADILLDAIQAAIEACAGSEHLGECVTEKIMSECLTYYSQERCEGILSDMTDAYIEYNNAKEALFFYGDYESSYGSYEIDVSIDSMNNMEGISLESSMQGKAFYSNGSYTDEFVLEPFTVKLIIIGNGCSDGTAYNQCNADGLYCNDFGQLVEDCEHCGCDEGTCYHKECIYCGNGVCDDNETGVQDTADTRIYCPQDCRPDCGCSGGIR
ncbi:MAG: hypothetical protein U9Q92_03035, partial [archaeon]|nr:hypothetical protein [archaeon]